MAVVDNIRNLRTALVECGLVDDGLTFGHASGGAGFVITGLRCVRPPPRLPVSRPRPSQDVRYPSIGTRIFTI
jgi:hypothetical protein